MHGRSKGGLTTRIYALVDARGLPILLKITPGQAHDGCSADDMFDGLTNGDALRTEIAERAAWANIRAMPQRTKPPAFSHYSYKLRNAVERFFSKIKHYRAVATRCEKHPEKYLAAIKLAAVRIWMRFMGR